MLNKQCALILDYLDSHRDKPVPIADLKRECRVDYAITSSIEYLMSLKYIKRSIYPYTADCYFLSDAGKIAIDCHRHEQRQRIFATIISIVTLVVALLAWLCPIIL